MFPFITNYGREMRVGVNLRKKGKIKKTTEFVERIRKVHKEIRSILIRV